MTFAALRFCYYGWIDELYIQPDFHFSYFGMDWIQPLPGIGMYLVFAGLATSAFCIAIGFKFRWMSVSYFLLFTYVELLDKATYLNHYYFISIVAFLLCFSPAHKALSVDAWRKGSSVLKVPRFFIWSFMLQLGVVYFFAGVAKLHSEWLFAAMPMRTWLPARADMPIIGWLFMYEETAYVFSWAGALYDLSIAFLLCWRVSRPFAYLSVVVFHILTWMLFPIGIFPWVMIFMTLIFFPAHSHAFVWSPIQRFFEASGRVVSRLTAERNSVPSIILGVFVLHFIVQLVTPLRSHWQSENIFWDELGFRFSWRVMLIEKAGAIDFHVIDPSTGRKAIVAPSEHLTKLQEREMATQPDMIIEYVHYLSDIYREKGIESPEIYADSWVAVNGSGSQRFIDPKINLMSVDPNDRLSWMLKQEYYVQFGEK
ncbi:MAG: HTTM domain-containing protein [Flavobacteriales bacterium]|nr:HTTM domain-containing protein [Flavobacteriales bacterium]